MKFRFPDDNSFPLLVDDDDELLLEWMEKISRAKWDEVIGGLEDYLLSSSSSSSSSKLPINGRDRRIFGILLGAAMYIPQTPESFFRSLLRICPESVFFQDAGLRTPLHVAVVQCCHRPLIIRLLLQTTATTTTTTTTTAFNALKDLVSLRDYVGERPIDVLTRRILMKDERMKYRSAMTEAKRAETLGLLMQTVECARIVVACHGHQRYASRVLREEPSVSASVSASASAAYGACTPMLHVCLSVTDEDEIPVSLIERTLRKDRKELGQLVDSEGNLALHVAASEFLSRDRDDGFLLGKILQAYPKAASVKNKAGLLPLHLAITAGRVWNTGIEKLLVEFPEGFDSAQRKIPMSHYPIILHKLLDRGYPSIVFGILRVRPSLIQARCSYRNQKSS